LEDFLEITTVGHIFGATFFPQKICINFGEEWVGLHFGRFFHKLIRSPCAAATVDFWTRSKGKKKTLAFE
jgi:hypothetical protein